MAPTYRILSAIWASALCTAAEPTNPPLTPFGRSILDTHNRERVPLGSPALRWDPTLEAAAAAYARQLASGGPFTHSARAGRANQGESLSMGMRGSTAQQMMRNWIEEKRTFVPGIFPDVSRTGQWSDSAHYSQMIWSTTTSIGCGQATGAQWDYLVCRYSPAGNIDGRPVLTTPCGPSAVGAALGTPMSTATVVTRPPCFRG